MTVFPYQTWLDALALGRQGGIIFPMATRQLIWEHSLRIEDADYSGSTFAAQVRAYPDSGTILATVTIGTVAYTGGNTVVPMTLAAGTGANSTGVLPADSDQDGVEYFPIDVLITTSGVTRRLIAGLLPVTGYVTLP